MDEEEFKRRVIALDKDNQLLLLEFCQQLLPALENNDTRTARRVLMITVDVPAAHAGEATLRCASLNAAPEEVLTLLEHATQSVIDSDIAETAGRMH